jgi:GrpB-like predicted nucleotidyltransferase (UPF0157 family)
LLERVLEPWLLEGIHHIGSTAVSGLASKPIVDMMAGVRDLEQARAAYGPLEDEGYIDEPHRPEEAHHFAKPSLKLAERVYNLHLTEPGSDLWRERLAFRDALRADSELAREYEELKLRLAGENPDDVRAYTVAKREFVAAVLARAGIELKPRGGR